MKLSELDGYHKDIATRLRQTYRELKFKLNYDNQWCLGTVMAFDCGDLQDRLTATEFMRQKPKYSKIVFRRKNK